MKKTLLMIQIAVCLFGFMACSSSDDDNNIQEMEQVAIKQSDLIGVWISGDYFVSFGADGFYSAFLDDHFIDSGKYAIEADRNNEIVTYNIFTKQNTEYHVTSIKENSFVAEITYRQLNGQSYTKTILFTKSNKNVAKERNGLIGASWNGTKHINGIEINYNARITTYNFGSLHTDYEPAKNCMLIFFYVYLDDVVYYQLFNQNENSPTIIGWNDTADTYMVQQWKSGEM